MPVKPILSGGARGRPLGVFLRVVLKFSLLQQTGTMCFTWIESISTESTRAPSFANNAARGRPTTSDLRRVCWCRSPSHRSYHPPVDNGDNPSIGPVSIWQDPVIHPHVLETFHDRERRARKDRFDRPRWGPIINSYRDLPRRRDSGLR